jgi:hypothetical protein
MGEDFRRATLVTRVADAVIKAHFPFVCATGMSPDRERVPDRCTSSGSAVDLCRGAPAGAQRAERAADGGIGCVLRALSALPRVP